MSRAERVEAVPPGLDIDLNQESDSEYGGGPVGVAAHASASRRRDRSRTVRRYLLVGDLSALVGAFAALQVIFPAQSVDDRLSLDSELLQIGRASCRERV